MSREFISLMIVAVLSLITNISILILLIVKEHCKNGSKNAFWGLFKTKNQDPDQLGVVFCRNCGSTFDSQLEACPFCKPPRE